MLSHNISTLIAIAVAMIFILLNIKKLFCKPSRSKIWKYLVINGMFIILISLFFYVPLLEHKNATEYIAFHIGENVAGFFNQRIYPHQLIFSKSQFQWSYPLYANKINETMSFSIGVPIIVALLLTPITLSRIDKKYKDLYEVILFVGFVSALMATTLFPWEYMPIIPSIMQFPWRLLFISTFAFSIIAGVNIYKNIQGINIKNMYIVLLIIMLCAGNLISNITIFDTQFNVDYVYNSEKLEKKQCAEYEYLPERAYISLDYIKKRSSGAVILSGKADISDEQKNGSNMKFTISNNEGVSLELPFIYYLGYDIKINEKSIEYKESIHGFASIDVPENENGEVIISYKGTKLGRVSFYISLISALALLAYIIFSIYKNKGEKWKK